jgi:hypothetical protein
MSAPSEIVPVAEAAPAVPAVPVPLEPVPHGHRRRRRDGKIVKHSTLRYHVYKLARRELKRNKTYYLSGFEDKPYYELSTVDAWVQVRSYQARHLVERLSARHFINENTASKVGEVIQAVCSWIVSHPREAEQFPMASAATWVVILTLHCLASEISSEWAFESQDLVDRFTPSKLWDMFENAPPSEQLDGVRVLPYDGVLAMNCAPNDSAGANFESLLHAVRNCKDGGLDARPIPHLMPGVASLTPPRRIVFSQCGKQYA